MNEMDDCFKQEDRDELKKHGWQLTSIAQALKEMKEDAKIKADDIERRVRALENFKWIVWGMGTMAGVLLGWFLGSIKK